MGRRSSIYVGVDVYIDDILGELSDAELREELFARHRQKPIEGEHLFLEAYERLKQGDSDEALLLLQRALFPKWKTSEDSIKALSLFKEKQ